MFAFRVNVKSRKCNEITSVCSEDHSFLGLTTFFVHKTCACSSHSHTMYYYAVSFFSREIAKNVSVVLFFLKKNGQEL